MSSFRNARAATLAMCLLFLAACGQVSVTGPCQVQSNSSITIDIAWSDPEGSGGASIGTTIEGVTVRSLQSRLGKGPKRVSANAERDSVMVMVEYPEAWGYDSAQGDIGGGAATVQASASTFYCDPSGFPPPRAGYDRHYFKISNGAPLPSTASGTLHVTFDTGTMAPGVYHPMTMVAFEPAPDSSCEPTFAFHRVTSGAVQQVAVDMTSHLNSDIIVNSGDDVQDPLFVATDDTEPTQYLAFTSVARAGNGFALPNDGLLTPARAQSEWSAWLDLAGGTGTIDMPECLPSVQLAFDDLDNGDNAWMAQPGDDMLSLDVPPRQYAELLLYVTGGADYNIANQEALINLMRVRLVYEDGSDDEVESVLPVLGIPFAYGMFAPGMSILPTYSMAFSGVLQVDGSAPGQTSSPIPVSLPTGIAAIALSPDPSKTLNRVEISHVPAMASVPVTGGVQADQDPSTGDSFAVWAVSAQAVGAAAAATDVPALSHWAVLVLCCALVAFGAMRMRT